MTIVADTGAGAPAATVLRVEDAVSKMSPGLQWTLGDWRGLQGRGLREVAGSASDPVNDAHLLLVHSATVRGDSRERTIHVTKIRGRELNVDRP